MGCMLFIRSSRPGHTRGSGLLLRTAGSVADVITLFRLAIFEGFTGTLFSFAVNVTVTLGAMVLMRRMHSDAYQVFYNFVTGVLNPSVLIVQAALVVVILGFEFILVGITSYEKGYVPPIMMKIIMGIRSSIVVQSGVTFALAVAMFASDPVTQWRAYATAAIYLASAYVFAFLGLAPYWLESRRLSDRLSLIVAGGGLIALVWYWPDIFNPDVIKFKAVTG